MVQLIDKAVVVAEIKRISCENPMDNSWYVDTEELLNFINTIEVKEIGVDLGDPKGDKTAKYIIDTNTLEVKEVNLEIEQRMRECPYRQVGCTLYENKILECNGTCSWVVDYPKLKELKAQEGE